MRKLVPSLLLLLFTLQVIAQNRTVTGRVTAKDDGLPMPGVSVTVKGTTAGSQTGADGRYSISVPTGAATLVFSFIGYTRKEAVVGADNIVDVVLETDVNVLGEVVVTALGVTRERKAIGYSVSTVSPETILQKSEPDVLKNLSGRVSGVDIRTSQGTPGAATRINLRGYTSFYGTNEPLIIVDGIPYSNEMVTAADQTAGGGAYQSGLSSLDPNDIESISVLKGAAASALYGSRASDGALIIKTKSGSSRVTQKGLEVTYSSSASMENIANLPKYQNVYGAGTLFTYAAANGSWGAKFGTIDSIPTWPDYLAAFPNLFGPNVAFRAYPNNVKDLFRTGKAIENSISLSGGSEMIRVSSTASYLNHDGYVPNSNFNRANLSLGGEAKLANKLMLNGSFSLSKSNQLGGVFGENQVEGAASAWARNLFLARNWDLTLPYEDANGLPVSTSRAQYDNPLWSWQHNTVKTKTNRYVAGLKLGYDINSWINASYQIGINNNNFIRREVIDIGSRGAEGLGSITDQDYQKEEIESNLILLLKPALTGDFSLSGTLGYNINQRTVNTQAIQGNQIVVAGIYNISNTKTLLPLKIEGSDQTYYEQRRLWGLFGEASLGYKGFAYLTATGRNDWSSTLPTDNRSYFYPSVSGSLVFTDALNKGNWGPLDFGKIRASWAKVGRDADPYALQNLYLVQDPILGQPSATQSDVARNPNLEPEFTQDIEVGTQLEFFKQRLSLDFAWYNRISTNQIAAIEVPPTSGFEQAYANFGKLSNKGIELELGITPLRTRDFSLNLKGVFTKNKSEVKELLPGVDRISLEGVLDEISPYIEVGKPFGYLRGTVNARDTEGNLLIDPQTGLLIRGIEQQMIGDPNPDYKAGINLGINYKGFFLSSLFDWTKGGDLYSVTASSLLGRGVTRDTEDREAGYIIPGYYGDPNTGLPLTDAGGAQIPNSTTVSMNELFFGESFAINSATEWNVYDATVYTWRELTLGYNFPKKLYQRLPIGGATLTFSARNLWYLAPNFPKYTNFNPEVNSFGSSSTQGIELSGAPTTRRFGLNLKITF